MKEIGEGSLHPRPEGRGIRDPPHSHCNKSLNGWKGKIWKCDGDDASDFEDCADDFAEEHRPGQPDQVLVVNNLTNISY